MQSTQLFSVLIIILAMTFTCGSSMRLYTRTCNEAPCNDLCNDCIYGTAYSHTCGFDVCAKGPFQPCSEYESLCGEGLTCSRGCNVCRGCSTVRSGPCNNDVCIHDIRLLANNYV